MKHQMVKNLAIGALLAALGGCAQLETMSRNLALRFSGGEAKVNQANAALGQMLQAQSASQSDIKNLTDKTQKLEAEKSALRDSLRAAESGTLLVQVDGGDIKLNRTTDLPACETQKAAISGMPGRDKENLPPYRSAFSVGSVSPYTPKHMLLSTCLPLTDVPSL